MECSALIDEKNLLIGYTRNSLYYIHQYKVNDDNDIIFLDKISGIKVGYICQIRKIKGERLIISEFVNGELLLLS